MIIDPDDPMQPLDKYHNPKHMVNPYGSFKTHVPKKSTLADRIDDNMDLLDESNGQPRHYSKALLKQAYSHIHPRQNVNETLNYQIRAMKRRQIEYYANESGKYLAQIHDSDPTTLSPERVWNLKDIANPKNHEYWTDKKGRSHISPDDFLDLNGKSDAHLLWDRQYWENKAIGDQNNPKQQKSDGKLDNDFNWFNYHAKKFAYDSTYPWIGGATHKKVLLDRQGNAMERWDADIHKHFNHGSQSWLAKMKLAKGWLTYHQNKLYYYQYYYPVTHKHGIKVQQRYVKDWQKKLNYDTQHKNEDYNYYLKYKRGVQKRYHDELMRWEWKQIHIQIRDNDANHLTSIYRADGLDPRVVHVAELSPTEEIGVNVPTKSIDDGMPQTDWTQTNQEQLSGNYTIYLHDDVPEDLNYGHTSRSYNDRVSQYVILKRWGKQGRLLRIRGFNTWNSILISDLQRIADQSSSGNGLQLQITFQHARLAHIRYSKNKKAQGRPNKGRNNGNNAQHITVKPYNTFWGFATKYGGTVSNWEAANPHAVATDLQIGSKLVIPKEAKVNASA